MSQRVRREPPHFRRVAVQQVETITARMVRVTLAGPELEGFAVEQPAASVRLLLPPPGTHELVMPTWNGNEFLLPDGGRPVIRTFTPGAADPDAGALELDIVVHGHGVASEWAAHAEPGLPAAISGPGRGYIPVPDAVGYLLAGDETALPAIRQLLDGVTAPTHTLVEIAAADARQDLPDVTWLDLPRGAPPGTALVAAVADAPLAPGTRVWAAGEAAAMQRIRRHLFEERGVSRREATVRGYWKSGRAGDPDDETAAR